MCFSAQASFIAGTSLSLFGLTVLRSSNKQSMYIRAIPLMFGIQQLFEGLVWITQGNSNYTQYTMIGSYGFLFFAFFAWPIWTPFALYKYETDAKRKKILFGLMMAGAVVATLLAWGVLSLGVTSAISCSHIKYSVNWPQTFELPLTMWYCLATVGSLFVMKKRMFYVIGLVGILSIGVSAIAYYQWFTSVWCFFAALLSFAIYRVK